MDQFFLGFSITVCPLESDSSKRHLIEFFSAGWRQPNRIESKEPSSVVSVEFLEPDDGDFSFSWLELSKRPLQGLGKHHFNVKFKPESLILNFYRRLSLSMSRIRSVCQFFDMVRWYCPMPIRL